jgi:hypothetical protein
MACFQYPKADAMMRWMSSWAIWKAQYQRNQNTAIAAHFGPAKQAQQMSPYCWARVRVQTVHYNVQARRRGHWLVYQVQKQQSLAVITYTTREACFIIILFERFFRREGRRIIAAIN